MLPTTDKRLPGGLVTGLLLALLVLLVVLVTGLGYIHISPSQVVDILSRGLGGAGVPAPGPEQVLYRVVWEVRLPRILTAVVVGASLGLAGAVFQGILLNPLADPFTLGVSSGAAFGASVALIAGLDFLGPYTVSLLAFAGAAATLFAVLWLSTVDGQLSPHNLILSGVIVAAILSAGISFIKYLADEQVAVIIFWLMGSLVSRTWLDAGICAAFFAAGVLICLYYARELNLLSLGQRSARSLGVDTRRVRLTLLLAASLVSAAAVSVSGIIGFVGLLMPHLMRFLVGPDNRRLMPASALAGALLLLLADTTTRAFLPHEVPIGVLTALIGGPFFCWIFRRRQLGGRGV